MSKGASQFVMSHLNSCIPAGVPSPYVKLKSARYLKKDRGFVSAVANIQMFDGTIDQYVVKSVDGQFHHCRTSLSGADIQFKPEWGCWSRLSTTRREG